ncbi:MAG TPA: AMP-binding protein [Firmicutes bacterium]|nr:AMP-binding protein [Bacillota bacterium]
MAQLFESYVRKDYEDYEDFYKNYKLNVPENFNFAYDCMDVLAEKSPDKLAMRWTNVAGDKRDFTFAEMKYYSDKTANYLKSLGIKKGDAVMLILKRHYEYWWTILALHKLGAITIPASNLLTPKDIIYRCNMADIKCIVCTADGDISHRVQEAAPECPSLKLLITTNAPENSHWLDFHKGVDAASSEFIRPTGEEATKNSDIMLIYFTSGTTGMPKMVAHDYLYALAHITTAAFWHRVDPDGIHLTVSDTGWGKAAWGKLYGQWLAETCIMVYDFDKFIPCDLLQIMQDYKITTFCAPPTIYRFLVKEDMSKYDLSSLKECTNAGEPLNPEIMDKFREFTGITLREGYGQTETTLTLATYPGMKVCPGSMGRPTPGYEITLLDENGQLVPDGDVGEIVIRADRDNKPVGMFLGYYRDEELTNSAWHDGYYHTGDTAWRDEHGYYWFVGRTDDVIKSSGYRIGPFEVESALLEHPAVLECAITGMPHPIRGQIVKATVVLSKGYSPSDELIKELQEHVKHTTAPYKYPRVIEFVEELPKTISGKIRRVQIREEDKG